MSRKRISPVRKNWQMAQRINDVTGQEVQSARTTAAQLKGKVQMRRFMNDDAYVRAVLRAEPTAPRRDLSDLERLEIMIDFVEQVGGIEEAKRVLDTYERIVNA